MSKMHASCKQYRWHVESACSVSPIPASIKRCSVECQKTCRRRLMLNSAYPHLLKSFERPYGSGAWLADKLQMTITGRLSANATCTLLIHASKRSAVFNLKISSVLILLLQPRDGFIHSKCRQLILDGSHFVVIDKHSFDT